MRTRAQAQADDGRETVLAVSVNVHISPDTTVHVQTYPEQQRVTVAFEGGRHLTDVTLFLHRRELQDLRDLLGDTLAALPAATGDHAPTPGGGAETVTDRAA